MLGVEVTVAHTGDKPDRCSVGFLAIARFLCLTRHMHMRMRGFWLDRYGDATTTTTMLEGSHVYYVSRN